MYSKKNFEEAYIQNAYERVMNIKSDYEYPKHAAKKSWSEVIKLYREKNPGANSRAASEAIWDRALWKSMNNGLPGGFGPIVLRNYLKVGMKAYLERRGISASDEEIVNYINGHVVKSANGRGMLLSH